MRKVFLLLSLPDQLGKFILSSPTHALSTGALQTPLITLHQFTSEGFKKLEEKKRCWKRDSPRAQRHVTSVQRAPSPRTSLGQ